MVAYLQIVRLFIKRIQWICILGLPIGAVLGMYIGVQEKGVLITMNTWFFIIGTSTVIGLLLYVPMKYWYIPTLYGSTEKRLKELLEQLEAEN